MAAAAAAKKAEEEAAAAAKRAEEERLAAEKAEGERLAAEKKAAEEEEIRNRPRLLQLAIDEERLATLVSEHGHRAAEVQTLHRQRDYIISQTARSPLHHSTYAHHITACVLVSVAFESSMLRVVVSAVPFSKYDGMFVAPDPTQA